MEFTELLIPAVLILGVAVLIFIFTYFSTKNKILRKLSKVRRKQIYQVRDREYVKIVGKAKHAGTPLIAPLSKRTCVFYHVKVEQKNDKHWSTIVNDIQFQDFFIQTGTDNAAIHLKKTRNSDKKVHLVTDHSFSSGFMKDADPATENYLKSFNKKSVGFLGLNKTLKYTERIVEIDEEIAVMGIGKWTTLDTPIDGYSDSRVLTLSGIPKYPLLITDEPKALKRVEERL